MEKEREKLIFGRYHRDECGLPPLEDKSLAKWKALARAVGAVCAVLVVGWLAGSLASRWRAMRLEALPGQMAKAVGPEEKSRLLAQGRILATALRDDPRARLSLAEACLIASVNAPRQMGYFGNIAALLAGVADRSGQSDLDVFRAESLHAHVLAELNRHNEALACLARADSALKNLPDNKMSRALRLNLVNLQAYILATAPGRHVRNPEKALHLAQVMVSSRDELPGGEYASGVAAYVDTLASAWYAAGDAEKALKTQTLALGLAKPGDLAVYLKHYDQFAKASATRSPGLVAFFVY